MTWAVKADVDKFDEAVAWFRTRVPYTTDQLDKIEDSARARAFTIAGQLELDTVQTIYDGIGTSIEKGTPIDDFKKSMREKLEGKVGPDGYHLETVYRNWVQNSYNTGRWYQLTDPELVLLRPYLIYDSVLDTRTTQICKDLDGTCKLHDDPFWLTHHPLMHHRCRASLRSLRRKQAERHGITTEDPAVDVPDGFGLAPPVRGDNVPAPDPRRFDPQVWEVFKQRSEKFQSELHVANDNARKKRKKRDEQDPQHWFDREFKAKYGDSAGKAVAWGKAMENRGRALSIEDARAAHKKLVRVGAKASPFADDLFERTAKLPGKAIKEAKDVGALIDALDAAGHASDAREMRVTASLIGHTQSITPTTGPQFPIPRWQGAWTNAAKERLVQDHERASEFLGALTDESVASPSLRLVARHQRAAFGGGTIYCNGGQYAGDLVHEWGHALEEYSVKVREAAQQFLAVRTANESARRLRDIFPNRAYAKHEISKRDGFHHAYMGKIYPGGQTELTSMGLELIRVQEAAELYSTDPEHFWMVLGVLAGGKLP